MPTVADVEIIAKTLGSIPAGKPQRHGALTVIPILAPMQTESEWLTLAEAGDRVRITEVDEEGSVPDLRVATLGDLPLLLLDGEQLVGAKQNRILNMTVLVAAQSEVTIAVTCVEQGRRGYRARHSAPSDFSLYAGLRAKKSAWVSHSLREGVTLRGRLLRAGNCQSLAALGRSGNRAYGLWTLHNISVILTRQMKPSAGRLLS